LYTHDEFLWVDEVKYEDSPSESEDSEVLIPNPTSPHADRGKVTEADMYLDMPGLMDMSDTDLDNKYSDLPGLMSVSDTDSKWDSDDSDEISDKISKDQDDISLNDTIKHLAFKPPCNIALDTKANSRPPSPDGKKFVNGYETEDEIPPLQYDFEDSDDEFEDGFMDFEDSDWQSDNDSEHATYPIMFLTDEAICNAKERTEIYNSGASSHMTRSKEDLKNFCPIPAKDVNTANGKFQAVRLGDMEISVPGPQKTMLKIVLKDILYAPNMTVTLVLIGKMAEKGKTIIFQGDKCKILSSRKMVIGIIKLTNGLYHVHHGRESGMTAVNSKEKPEKIEKMTMWQLHCRMGHANYDTIQKMIIDGLVKGVELLDDGKDDGTCDSCAYAKTTWKPINSECTYLRAKEPGGVIHSDLWGPAPVQTPSHKNYYSSFTDYYSCYTSLYLQQTKDKAFEKYKHFEAKLKTQKNVKIKCLHSDWGGEFRSDAFVKPNGAAE
jgi:hypothetical protein